MPLVNPLTPNIAKVARALAQQFDVKVTFRGNQACTDGKQIIFPAYVQDVSQDAQDMLLAFGFHEVGHILFTDWGQSRKALTEAKVNPVLLKSMENWIEDVRMERRQISYYPGTEYVFKKVWDKSFGVQNWEHYEQAPLLEKLGFAIRERYTPYINYVKDRHSEQVLMLLDMLEDAGILGRMTALNCTADSYSIAQDILLFIKDLQQQEQEQEQQQQQQDNDDSSEDGDAGDADASDSDSDGDGASDSGQNEPSSKPQSKTPREQKDSKNKEADEGDDEGDDSTNEGNKERAKSSKPTSDSPSNDKESRDNDNDRGEDDSADANKSKGGAQGAGEGGEEGDKGADAGADAAGEKSGASAEETDSAEGQDSPHENDVTGSDKGLGTSLSKENLDFDVTDERKKQAVDMLPSAVRSPESARPQYDRDATELSSEQAAANPFGFQAGGLNDNTEPSKSGNEKLDRTLMQDFSEEVNKIIARDIAESGPVYWVASYKSDRVERPSPHPEEYVKAREGLASKTAVLASKLQKQLLAEKKVRRRYDRDVGEIDADGLAGWMCDKSKRSRPFMDLIKKQYKDTAVTILLDNSGSMSGNKILLCQQTAIILHEVFTSLSIPHEVLGYTTGKDIAGLYKHYGKRDVGSRDQSLRHFVYKGFDQSGRCTSLGAIAAYNQNADGEAVWWAGTRLLRRHEERKVLLVVCDGWPSATLNPTTANAFLKQMVRKVEACDVEVHALGIASESVKEFYSNYSIIYDENEISEQIIKLFSRVMR